MEVDSAGVGGWLRLLRRYPRVHLETAVAIACHGRAYLAQALDVCEGGLGIELASHLPEGASVSVTFHLLGEAIEMEATVVHGERTATGIVFCGLAFTQMHVNARRVLRRYINNRRFLHGDLRAPTDNPDVGKRMTERLGKVRRLTLLT